MCPYYLDGDLRAACAAPGDTRVIGYCAVFKVREEAALGGLPRAVSQSSTACGRPGELDARACGPPGPVDVLVAERSGGDRRGDEAPPPGARGPRHDDPSGARCPVQGSLERR